MARIVIVAGTDAGQDVAAALSAAGHQIVRAESLAAPGVASQGDRVLIEPWLFAAGSTPLDVPVVMLTNGDAVPAAVEAVKSGGAFDILRVPSSRDEIRTVVERALRVDQLWRENQNLRQQLGMAAASANGAAQPAGAAASAEGDSLASAARNLAGTPLADIEKQVILSTLEQFKGHRIKTATALGIGVRTLGMKIKKWREEGEPIEVGA